MTESEVLAIIEKRACCTVTPDERLADIGLDSLDRIGLLWDLCDAAHGDCGSVALKESLEAKYHSFTTVSEVVGLFAGMELRA